MRVLCLNPQSQRWTSTLDLDSRQKRHIDVSVTEMNSTAQYRSVRSTRTRIACMNVCVLYHYYQGRIRRGGAKGAVAPPPPPKPRKCFSNTKMDPSPQCSPLKLGSIMKLTTKIHQKCPTKTGLSAATCTRSRPFCRRGLKFFARDYYF